jgi:peptidyl-prolyl cis-trans isomerase B (cyclophilin B)
MKHTVFGSVSQGQDVVNAIRVGDKIKSVEVLDSTDALFAAQADNITTWNRILDRRS